MKSAYDVVIIGAGVSGCAIARELARYDLSILVIDRESDVCEGTSKANSGIVHGGFDAKPGSLKAMLNVRGNLMMDDVARELDVPFKRIGAMVIARSEEEMPAIERLYDHGVSNGVPDIRIIDGSEALAMEPGLTPDVHSALYVPTSGIVCPFELTVAYAENAYANGVEFALSTEVLSIRRKDGKAKVEGAGAGAEFGRTGGTGTGAEFGRTGDAGAGAEFGRTGDVGTARADKSNGESAGVFEVETSAGVVSARCVVNAAGVWSAKIHDMICEPAFTITARKGEYMLLDKSAGDTVTHTIFQVPTKMGKGVLVTPTVHGNLLVGPTAYDIEDKEDTSTTRDGIGTVRSKSAASVPDIPYKKVITSFSGLRATGSTGDFMIGEDAGVKGFVDVAGIESPGLSSAPAVGLYVRDIVLGIFERTDGVLPVAKESFDPVRRGIPRPAGMRPAERAALIAERPDYGHIVCRCEDISEGEILDSIRRPLGATTLDGVKRRVRAGMGRCQGGFCAPKVIEMLAAELGISYAEVKKNG